MPLLNFSAKAECTCGAVLTFGGGNCMLNFERADFRCLNCNKQIFGVEFSQDKLSDPPVLEEPPVPGEPPSIEAPAGQVVAGVSKKKSKSPYLEGPKIPVAPKHVQQTPMRPQAPLEQPGPQPSQGEITTVLAPALQADNAQKHLSMLPELGEIA